MHKITLLSVGKVKTAWIKDGCELYADRLSHFCDLSERVLNAGEEKEERQKIVDVLEKTTGVIVALDDKGKEFSSTEFASWVGKQRDHGQAVTFVLGGAYGLDDRIRTKSNLVLSLSRMTLPHELCKLVFLEQLYRAHAILAGSGYHH
jgi:23S rRNA (pseudouridine1915-N3)-methyltransferase